MIFKLRETVTLYWDQLLKLDKDMELKRMIQWKSARFQDMQKREIFIELSKTLQEVNLKKFRWYFSRSQRIQQEVCIMMWNRFIKKKELQLSFWPAIQIKGVFPSIQTCCYRWLKKSVEHSGLLIQKKRKPLWLEFQS